MFLFVFTCLCVCFVAAKDLMECLAHITYHIDIYFLPKSEVNIQSSFNEASGFVCHLILRRVVGYDLRLVTIMIQEARPNFIAI